MASNAHEALDTQRLGESRNIKWQLIVTGEAIDFNLPNPTPALYAPAPVPGT